MAISLQTMLTWSYVGLNDTYLAKSSADQYGLGDILNEMYTQISSGGMITLSGDVIGLNTATVVALVGGKTASAVASAVTTVAAATSSNTASALALRDSNGSLQVTAISAPSESSFNLVTGIITAPGSVNSIDTQGRVLYNASATEVMNWSDSLLLGGNQSVDWANRILCDTSGRNAIEWGSGNLVVDNGTGINQPQIAQNWSSQSGTTGQRPTTTSLLTGFFFFDTSLGKPIWWSGSNWVDATGATV
jgi:hypothetical protein